MLCVERQKGSRWADGMESNGWMESAR
jgi:hypothetical protein